MTEKRTNAIGQYLKEGRLARGWLLKDVAQRAGVAISTVSRIESGDLLPTVDVLTRLSEALEIDLADLLACMGVAAQRTLPDLTHYLREKYPSLSAEAVLDIEAHFQRHMDVTVDETTQ
jgi:transcriptional regulator with XRE-family HTH domain